MVTLTDKILQSDFVYIDGTVETRPSYNERIPVRNLTIVGDSKYRSVIKRPDFSIGKNKLNRTDDNYGIYLVPDKPRDDDKVEWVNGVGFLVRGDVVIENLGVDCNMAKQGVESLPSNKIEHSAMICLEGATYNTTNGPVHVAFNSVLVKDVLISNRGYSDCFLHKRGYFKPNIESVVYDNVRSINNVTGRRADIQFSGLVKRASIVNCNVDKIEAEADSSWSGANSLNDHYKSKIKITDTQVRNLDLSAKGKSLDLIAENLRTGNSTYLYQLGGRSIDCEYVVPYGENRRLNRLDNYLFDRTRFLIEGLDGNYRGMRPEGFFGEPCIATWRDCEFSANGEVKGGIIMETERSADPDQHVDLTFINCKFDERFQVILVAREKGNYVLRGCNISPEKVVVNGEGINLVIED